MLTKINSEHRGKTKIGWLESYHSFSFSNFFNPEMMGFGPIRVLNDDRILPGSGFPKHPHRDMEIVTIILEGALAHEDSTGTKEVIRKGEVQRMSAGSGIMHSEFNNSNEEGVHLLQIWFLPNANGLKPSYDQKKFPITERINKLQKIVGSSDQNGELKIEQDADLFISFLEDQKTLEYSGRDNRGLYLYLIEGRLDVNGIKLSTGDAVKTNDETKLKIKADADSQFILFDVIMN